jgi:HB1, ASXL, restriction endonuclease HTH domain
VRAVDAAVSVLSRAGEPLHYREITQLALERGLWTSNARDPAKSLLVALSREARRGDRSRLIRVRRGTYVLTEWARSREVAVPYVHERPATELEGPLVGGAALEWFEGTHAHWTPLLLHAVDLASTRFEGKVEPRLVVPWDAEREEHADLFVELPAPVDDDDAWAILVGIYEELLETREIETPEIAFRHLNIVLSAPPRNLAPAAARLREDDSNL